MSHVDQLLSAYMDGELSMNEKEEVEQHLETCPHCQGLLEELIGTRRQLLSSFENITVPDEFTNNIITAIQLEEWAKEEQRRSQPLFSNRALRWSAIGSVLLLFIVNGAFIFTFGYLFSFNFLSILVNLAQCFLIVFASIPYLGMIVTIISLLFVVISVWCLRYLLSSKKVEVLL